jgi:hypothetical protein
MYLIWNLFWLTVLQLLYEIFLNWRIISEIISQKYLVVDVDYFKLTWIFSTNFSKSPSTKFHGNPFGRSRDVPCGQTDRRIDTPSDMTKQIVAFRNLANVYKIIRCSFQIKLVYPHKLCQEGPLSRFCMTFPEFNLSRLPTVPDVKPCLILRVQLPYYGDFVINLLKPSGFFTYNQA